VLENPDARKVRLREVADVVRNVRLEDPDAM
jgi:hypothetical protein